MVRDIQRMLRLHRSLPIMSLQFLEFLVLAQESISDKKNLGRPITAFQLNTQRLNLKLVKSPRLLERFRQDLALELQDKVTQSVNLTPASLTRVRTRC